MGAPMNTGIDFLIAASSFNCSDVEDILVLCCCKEALNDAFLAYAELMFQNLMVRRFDR